MIKYCEVKTTLAHAQGRCRGYRRFCHLYKKFGLHGAAKRHCHKMKVTHQLLVKDADKAAQKATEEKNTHVKKEEPEEKEEPPKKRIVPHHRGGLDETPAAAAAAAKKDGNIIDAAMKKLRWYKAKLKRRDQQVAVAKKATKAEIEAGAEDEKALAIEKNALHDEEKRLAKYRKAAHAAKHEERGEVRSERMKFRKEEDAVRKEEGRLAHYKHAAFSARNVENAERSKLKVLREELREAKSEDEAYAANNDKLGRLSAALRKARSAPAMEVFE
jgi:hypothetical protein